MEWRRIRKMNVMKVKEMNEDDTRMNGGDEWNGGG